MGVFDDRQSLADNKEYLLSHLNNQVLGADIDGFGADHQQSHVDSAYQHHAHMTVYNRGEEQLQNRRVYISIPQFE